MKLITLGLSPALDIESMRDRINKVWAVEHASQSGVHDFKTTQTTVGAAGSGAAVPATTEGFIVILVNGEQKVIPYFAQS